MSDGDRRWDRRTVLRTGLAAGTLAVAGCLREEGGGASTPTDGETPEGTTTGGTTTGEPATDESTTDSGPGQSVSPFYDDFEDGDYTTDPGWEFDGDGGSASVVQRQAPDGGQRALRLSGGSASAGGPTVSWADDRRGWDREWVAEGLVYPSQLPGGRNERNTHTVLVGLSANQGADGTGFFLVEEGDSSMNVTLAVGDDETSEAASPLDPGRWYRWELRHDGAGTLTGTRWAATGSKAQGASVTATGLSLQSSGTMYLQAFAGPDPDRKVVVDHAFVRWDPQ